MPARVVVFTDVATGRQSFTVQHPLDREDAWTTRDGTEIPLGEMGERHIENTIAFLRRRARILHHRYCMHQIHEISQGPFAPSGDMAQDAADDYLAELFGTPPAVWLEQTAIMRAFKAELVRRNEPPAVSEVPEEVALEAAGMDCYGSLQH